MAKDFGWEGEIKDQHNWQTLRNGIQNYIKGINFGYKSKMSEIGVDFVNAYAKFTNPNEVEF